MRLKLEKGKKAYMNLPVEVKAIDKEAGTLEAIFSTQDVDRHGDTVMQEGWELGPFKKNPVILDSHNYESATEVIGSAKNVRVEQKKLQGTITFAVKENPKAKVIFDLYVGGFLSAFSVGFIPSKFKENKDGTRDWYTIEEAELLEVSAVSVPANARALAKAKGIDTDVLGETPAEEAPAEDAGATGPEAEDGATGPEGDAETGATGATGPEADAEADAEGATGATGAEAPAEDAEGATGAAEPEAQAEPEPTPAKSHTQAVLAAIHSIESREKRAYRKAHAIIESLLKGDGEGQRTDRATREQLRKRKVNQAIRELLKAK